MLVMILVVGTLKVSKLFFQSLVGFHSFHPWVRFFDMTGMILVDSFVLTMSFFFSRMPGMFLIVGTLGVVPSVICGIH